MGFHVVELANYICSKADSLVGAGGDRAGLEDGVLRNLDDWCQLYQQVHADEINAYQTRLREEDWFLTRLADDCGNKGLGTWKVVGQLMSVGVDTTVTPIRQDFGHEIHLMAQRCQQDTMRILISLPNFEQMENEVTEREKAKAAGKNADGSK